MGPGPSAKNHVIRGRRKRKITPTPGREAPFFSAHCSIPPVSLLIKPIVAPDGKGEMIL
jgi:hypothetical protein